MLWGDKTYYSLNYYLRRKFGCKVFKISLDGGFSCPNRDGTISTGGCIFCSEKGSGDFAGNRNVSISNQFQGIKQMMNKKWKDGKYIAYFQAYTNTYAPVEILKQKYEEAINQEGVVGLAIATRPDCLGDDVLELLEKFNNKIYTWVELGLQSSDDFTAEKINRGYKLETFERSVKNLRKIGIEVVVHLIMGLPYENKDIMMNTVKYVSTQDIQGVKFHLLHLMEHTPLVKLYNEGQLKFMSQEDYVDVICSALSNTRPDIVIHRLTGDAPRSLLIGPKWSLKKWEVLNDIDKTMKDRNIYQGIYCGSNKK
ncbi:TIGR01212 family radical SAM protein [Clostridium coskatii]|uniref:Coproporphyrinogen III oxidase n=1 Tax=Clostridium coskatii TaxID=1705578 RepID=A0A166T196_9CLOT|nr:TIGR01212 family radical SAM protein [Clostridium coskatii]OAA93053.1 coproporphyrinogen III oxidase [Clostridium coskatii]OBR90796.1 coproporphyrinogen III oxidase [Clostridium coskatii]